MLVIEDYTVTMTCRTAITGLFLYLNLCPSVKLYNLSCSFTFISFPMALNYDLSLAPTFFICYRMVILAWTTFCLFVFVPLVIVLSVILRIPLWQNWYLFKLFALVLSLFKSKHTFIFINVFPKTFNVFFDISICNCYSTDCPPEMMSKLRMS